MSWCVIESQLGHLTRVNAAVGRKPRQYRYKSGLNVLTANRRTVETQRRGETATHDYPILVMVPILRPTSSKFPERYFSWFAAYFGDLTASSLSVSSKG
jgi:hypothetical protein